MAASMMVFSPSGDFFAFCGPDGTLRVWETATNTLKQEYVSSSHLSAACTCIKWRTERKIVENSGSSKRKKRKSEISSIVQNAADLIALGTSSGSVLIYSVIRGDLQAQWDNGHEEHVNDVSWSVNESTVYSCASDSSIIEWDVTNGKEKHKMKSQGPVFSICLCYDDKFLISASRVISLWDLSIHKIIQTFTGHATEVSRLLDVPMKSGSESLYFLSSAKDDRYIQIWQIKSWEKVKNNQKALATLQLPDDAVNLSVAGPLPDDGAYFFCAVTSSGCFLLFRQALNGECKKPLKPKLKLQIATSDVDVPKQVPVLTAMITSHEKLLLSYGNPMKPVFEGISYGGLEAENCLVREIPDSVVDKVGDVSKTKTPIVSEDVKVLTPGHLMPTKPSLSSGKKKRERTTSADMTVEERLDVMGLAETTSKPNLQTTSSAVLLAQGLQSRDEQIMNYVLQNTSPTFIRNTIRKLPMPLIIPLVDELSRRMQGHAQSSKSTIGWMKSLLTIHSSYLMTFPELVQNLSTLYQMMDSRAMMFSRLSKLQGRLELVISQVSDQSSGETAEMMDALVTLQDESSDEDTMVLPGEQEEMGGWDEDESELEEEEEDEKEGDESMDDNNSEMQSSEDNDSEVEEPEQSRRLSPKKRKKSESDEFSKNESDISDGADWFDDINGDNVDMDDEG